MFSQVAQKHWDAGLPVIPLKPRQKMPSPNAWQAYAHVMPGKDTQASWLEQYADGNIGLPLGPCSGICVIDIDTDDPALNKIILDQLPPTPWVRRGKKGAVYAFRHNGERTTRIKGADGAMIVELLGTSSQVVLPPSIHPDTQMPYTANAELVDVLHLLQPLPKDFEQNLRKSLIDHGVRLASRGTVQMATWIPSGGRDSAMVASAGLLARAVLTKERTLFEALAEAEQWVIDFTENVVGDPMDPAKARLKVMEFLHRDVVTMGKVLPAGWDLGLSDAEIGSARAYFGEHLEEWTLDEYTTWLSDKFIEIPRENHAGRTEIIDEVLTRLAKSQHLSEMQTDVIVRFIYNANARMITIPSIRKRIKELKGTEMTGADHTEIAQHLIKEIELFGQLRFEGTFFYQWKGSHWIQLHDSDMLKVLAEEFGHLPAAKRNGDHRGILATAANLVPRGLRDGPEVPGVNFANGYLTVDMQLLEHQPAYGARYVLPYRYAPNEGAPLRLFAFLDQAWGGMSDYMDQVQALREAMAATLFGVAPRFSRAVCLFGPAKTGKSTMKDIMQGMVPTEVVCSVPPHDWADKFLPTQMLGRLVNFCGELSEKEMIAGDRFKSIVEGEEMSGQMKGGQIFKFRPTCAHWFASNHLPRSRDTSAGFNRRWLFLHFTRMVTDGQKMIGLAQQILGEEQEAIAAWVVPAIMDLYSRQEYTLPQAHKDLISEVANQNNSVRFFLTSGWITVHPSSDDKPSKNHIFETALYQSYFAFCKLDANAPPVALKRFRLTLQELQDEIGFRLTIENTPSGQIATYWNLTFADRKPRS